jgi:hypothetical protein
MGELLAAVGTAVGVRRMAVVDPFEFGCPEIVRVTVYVPDAAGTSTGFCCVELKLPGPTHAYVAPDTVGEAVSVTEDPAHTPDGSVLFDAATGGTDTLMSFVAAGSTMPGYPDSEMVGLPGAVYVNVAPWQPVPLQVAGDAPAPKDQAVVGGGLASCTPFRSA